MDVALGLTAKKDKGLSLDDEYDESWSEDYQRFCSLCGLEI